jgi:hypothetical protein
VSQSAVLRAAYEAVYKNVSELGEKDGLFQMGGGAVEESQKDGQPPTVYLAVSDLCQLYPDKNGQKIETDEMIFEIPARVGCVFSLTIISGIYPPLLEAAGRLIQYFKDNNTVQLEGYKWHGEDEGKVFIEPVIRKPEPRRGPGRWDMPAVSLEYLLEVGINSLKGTPFKRVEKKMVKGNIIDR